MRTGSPRVRRGLGKLPNGTLAQPISEVQNSWQAQHFGNLKRRFRGKRKTFAAVQIHWRARRLRALGSRFAGRGNACAVSNDRKAVHK